MNGFPAFSRYIGIDYSGAETPLSSLKGLRVYAADRASLPFEVPPPPGLRKYWSRRGIAEWPTTSLSEETPTLVGIDHGFSFPLQYFQENNLPLNWMAFLDDFQRHWPTDENIYVDFVREGVCGKGAVRSGNRTWRRVTEKRCRAKSVFHFDVQGSVAKSTHSGLPWLRFIRLHTAGLVHFWPFDAWQIPAGKSAVVEVYPALWNRTFAQEGRDCHQHDAYTIAAWLRRADNDGSLASFLNPHLEEQERKLAEIEGWILGIV
ncbi:MAG: hypothetical protein QOE55_1657 [Acidobacteriaceae bacterium]|jgi:hypothetical protein|nr:hypothetical protein [Acidobacteriaceae bacterium]